MQSESVLILVFIFIILIAVVVIGILYSMHVSKYDESHTFYKNLLEIIKTNPNLSLDLQDKLLEKDFDISDLSTSQIELSNIFGAKIYSDGQINRVNATNTNYTEDRITTFTSNMLKDNERKYYQKAYNLIHDNNNLDLSNLYGIDFNNTGEVYNVLSNLHAVYDITNINEHYNFKSYSNMNVEMNILQGYAKYYSYTDNNITLNSNLITDRTIRTNSNLKICNNDVCFELSVNNDGILMGKRSGLDVPGTEDINAPFVFGNKYGTNSNLYLADNIIADTQYTGYSNFSLGP